MIILSRADCINHYGPNIILLGGGAAMLVCVVFSMSSRQRTSLNMHCTLISIADWQVSIVKWYYKWPRDNCEHRGMCICYMKIKGLEYSWIWESVELPGTNLCRCWRIAIFQPSIFTWPWIHKCFCFHMDTHIYAEKWCYGSTQGLLCA